MALVYLLGFALDLLNMFVASIAYPDIAQQLHASVTELAWITNAYMLGLTLIIPLSVWLAARVGERRLILASLLLFAIGSALVAQAVVARVAQMEMPVRREQLILAVVEAEEEVSQLREAALPAALAS